MSLSNPRLEQETEQDQLATPLPPLSSRPTAARTSRWSGRLVVGGIVVGVVGAALLGARPVVSHFSSSDKSTYSHLLTDIAYRGPFLLTVDIQGNLNSQQNVTVHNTVEEDTSIINIVPEGTWVEKGDLVCELDASLMVDEASKQQIVVTNAEAAKIQAEQAFKVQELQNQSDIANAKILWDLAELDLRKYTSKGGEYERLNNELSGKLELARQEAIQAKERHDFNKEQVKKGFINQNELEASRIQLQEKELAVGQAEKALGVLENFDKERTIAELSANAAELKRELDRVKLKAESAVKQAEQAYLAAAESAELERSILERLQRQIEDCKLRAPQSGEVVYANLSSSRRRGSSEGPAIEVGAQIDERQPIFHLPDNSKMKVDTRVHESLIGNVRVGLPCKIRVDARHDAEFRGVVAEVASVPTTGSWPNYNLREYPVSVNITDDPEKVKKLKPGLTAQVEIFVDSRNDVLQVPVTAVLGISGHYYAFVLTPKGPQRRELVIGQSNFTSVEVIDGVAEGERVILNPRTHFADEIAELSGQLGSQSDTLDAIRNKLNETPPPSSLESPAPSTDPSPASPFQKEGAGPVADAGGESPDGNRPPGAGRGNPAQMFAAMDADKDGKLAGDEIPGPLKDRVSTLDTDGDGAISQEEMSAGMKRFRGGDGAPGNAPEGAAGG